MGLITRHRKRNRLITYNYSYVGYYFITICVKNREEYFGKIIHDEMILNDHGEMIKKNWLRIPEFHPSIQLDEWIIMPNHIHGIIVIENGKSETAGTEHCSVPTRYGLLSKIIKSFKEACSKQIRIQYPGSLFCWQRSYYDHVIRNEESLFTIRRYIRDNPQKWYMDENNPVNIPIQ